MAAKGKFEYWISKDGLLRVEAYARDGLTDEQIAHNLNITTSTLYEWKKKFPDFSEALKKGKEVIDIQVENALLKRALGYSYDEVTQERIIDTGQKERHGGESELTEKQWEFAKKYFDGRCCYCGDHLELTKDHIKPLSKGGLLNALNIVPCCRKCNSSKKDNEMLSWYQKQTFYDKYRAQKIYDYIRLISELDIEKDVKEGLVVTKIVTKQVVPDTTAQIFWLKNRKPMEWRDRQNIEVSGEIDAEKSKLDAIMAQFEIK